MEYQVIPIPELVHRVVDAPSFLLQLEDGRIVICMVGPSPPLLH